MEGGSMSTVPTSLSQAQTRVHIRWMIRRDMPEVLVIEHGSFEYPWCEEEFLRVLRQRNCIGMVAEVGERIVGFMIYELHRSKIQLLDFAIHPDYRRSGVGRQMIVKLVSKLSTQRRNRIGLFVRETNLAAQFFFRVVGFRAIEVVREHFPDSGEDGYAMVYHLEESDIESSMPSNRIARQLGS
jgi:ribosomal-protein-alanine N-acetyltransferase